MNITYILFDHQRHHFLSSMRQYLFVLHLSKYSFIYALDARFSASHYSLWWPSSSSSSSCSTSSLAYSVKPASDTDAYARRAHTHHHHIAAIPRLSGFDCLHTDFFPTILCSIIFLILSDGRVVEQKRQRRRTDATNGKRSHDRPRGYGECQRNLALSTIELCAKRSTTAEDHKI